MERGRFIAVEGIDGSGKTTLIRNFLSHKEGEDWIYDTEPTHSISGRVIRDVIRNGTTDNLVLATLFASDRFYHSIALRNKLDCGIKTLCDRCLLSSLAYQTTGEDALEFEQVMKLNACALVPDLTIFVSIPAAVAIRRLLDKRGNMDELESKKIMTTVFKYNDAIEYVRKRHHWRVEIIDGNLTPEEVLDQLIRILR